MTRSQTFIEEMLERFQRAPCAPWWPDASDVARHSGRSAEAEMAFYNTVGEELVRGYHQGRLAFDFCDGVTNGLYAALIEGLSRQPQPPWPDLFYDVFLAFDAGEYPHHGDDAAVDPIEKYTKPLVQEIFARLHDKPSLE